MAWFGKHMDYRGLLAEVERCSAMLASLGVGKGDRVALVTPNCPQYVIAYFGITRLGAIVVGNNPLYTKREMEHQLRDCGAKVVLVLDLMYADFADVFATVGIEHVVVHRLNDYMPFPKKQLAPALRFKKAQREAGKPWPPVPGGRDGEVVARADARRPGRSRSRPQVDVVNDAAGFIYTGGTTGVSKGAMLSHRNIVANAMQGASYLGLEEGVEAMHVLAPVLPLVRDGRDERRGPAWRAS